MSRPTRTTTATSDEAAEPPPADVEARRWLLELTGLPTAAGCERHVIQWVHRWAAERPGIAISTDAHGNLMLERSGDAGGPAAATRPELILFTAHMDHPAFVVSEPAHDSPELRAEFRGGVLEAFFQGSAVLLHRGRRPLRGRVTHYQPPDPQREHDGIATIRFDSPITAEAGDILTWDLPAPRIRGDRLYAPACDDLAAVAAALAALDRLGEAAWHRNVRVLLTRAEEVGFIGAMAACHNRFIPPRARVIALENSRSFRESPIGAGPIVRVGDRTSTFDPDLTHRLGQIAEQLSAERPDFKWQRKLMAGGTCEATAFQQLGHTATCLCLPLGNYHNMADRGRQHAPRPPRIAAETISLNDYFNLIHLLTAIAHQLDATDTLPPLRTRLDALYTRRIGLLSGRG